MVVCVNAGCKFTASSSLSDVTASLSNTTGTDANLFNATNGELVTGFTTVVVCGEVATRVSGNKFGTVMPFAVGNNSAHVKHG